MNTLGLGKQIRALGLGAPYAGAIQVIWQELVKFTLYVRRVVEITLER